MEELKKRLITSYDEYIKEMKGSLEEPDLVETNENNGLPFQTDQEIETVEPVESNEVVEVIEPTDSEPVKESKIVLTLEEFLETKNIENPL
jgi:hypothetical protein